MSDQNNLVESLRKGEAAEAAEALLTWLQAFPTKDLERRLTLLLAHRRQLDLEIRFLQAQIARYRQYLEDLQTLQAPDETMERAHPVAAVTAKTTIGGTAQSAAQRSVRPERPERPDYPPKRIAVIRLLSETPGRAQRLADIRSKLIERGWLEDSDNARHALQVSLINMAKRGELERPEKGYYALTSSQFSEPLPLNSSPEKESSPLESENGASAEAEHPLSGDSPWAAERTGRLRE
jgi:hypothetical protein